VREEYSQQKVFPPANLIFNAFNLTPVSKVKVVILGQDPYHTPGAAMGLAFSVPKLHGRAQPSLQNIFQELQADLGGPLRTNTDLSDWAEAGVLLLNATLTVRANVAGSHQQLGWEKFTAAIIRKLSEEKEHLVFILWGKFAQSKAEFIDEQKHLVIKSAHPSPFSARNGFFGSKPFSRANAYLQLHKLVHIPWLGTD
jgi:uracil-DNA glycosylase